MFLIVFKQLQKIMKQFPAKAILLRTTITINERYNCVITIQNETYGNNHHSRCFLVYLYYINHLYITDQEYSIKYINATSDIFFDQLFLEHLFVYYPTVMCVFYRFTRGYMRPRIYSLSLVPNGQVQRYYQAGHHSPVFHTLQDESDRIKYRYDFFPQRELTPSWAYCSPGKLPIIPWSLHVGYRKSKQIKLSVYHRNRKENKCRDQKI